MSTATFRLRALVLAALAVLGTSVATGVAAADDSRPGRDADAPGPGAFLDLPDVDLGALGYDLGLFRPDVHDPGLLARLEAPLPESPWERVVELQHRVEAIPPVIGELGEIRAVLAAEVDELDPLVERLRRAASVAGRHEQEARRRAQEADEHLRARIAALGEHRAQMAEVAVEAYISPPDADVLSAVLGGAATTSDELAADVLFTAKADHDGVVREGIEVSIAVGNEQLHKAAKVAGRATARVGELEVRVRDAIARRDSHRAALTTVVEVLRSVEERLPGLEQDLETTMAEARAGMLGLAGIGIDGVPVVAVDGIRVHEAIAPALQALLTAARADGVPLDGWGYRTIEAQIMLRRAHCGPSPEDVFLKPASACSPPTAPPGASMHERGLAIDFHLGGQSISSRQSEGYRWLAEHAATYGFYNLPSEPWHWSVNGQ